MRFFLFLAACTSSAPCPATYTWADACTRLNIAINKPCPNEMRDCVMLSCKNPARVCAGDVDACEQNLHNAADCATAQALACHFTCVP